MIAPHMTTNSSTIDAYIEDVSVSVLSSSQYYETQSSRLLQDEWTRLRRKIDNDQPLYCTDLEEFSRDALIIAEKYVEDKSVVIETRKIGDGKGYGVDIAVTKAWDDYHTQLDKLFITGPLRHWARLKVLQEQSKMELMLMLERHVRDIKCEGRGFRC
jgi:hypothetical protein